MYIQCSACGDNVSMHFNHIENHATEKHDENKPFVFHTISQQSTIENIQIFNIWLYCVLYLGLNVNTLEMPNELSLRVLVYF